MYNNAFNLIYVVHLMCSPSFRKQAHDQLKFSSKALLSDGISSSFSTPCQHYLNVPDIYLFINKSSDKRAHNENSVPFKQDWPIHYQMA